MKEVYVVFENSHNVWTNSDEKEVVAVFSKKESAMRYCDKENSCHFNNCYNYETFDLYDC